MILVDTSVWIDHLRKGDARLASLLEEGEVCCHPFVIAEIALGYLQNRSTILEALKDLHRTEMASDGEFHAFIEAANLPGSGLGFVDAHLLASARLTPGVRLWTRDKRLDAIAHEMNLAPEFG